MYLTRRDYSSLKFYAYPDKRVLLMKCKFSCLFELFVIMTIPEINDLFDILIENWIIKY